MKRLITLLGLSLIATASQAQITLNQASYTNWQAGIDSISYINVSALSNISFAANGTWDLSGITYTGNSFITHANDTNWNFPNAEFKSFAYYPITQGLSYEVNMFSGISAAGMIQYGEEIEQQAYDISSFTFGPNDSLYVAYQNVIYTGEDTVIAFPATMGSTWTSSYRAATDFTVDVAAVPLTNAPVQRVGYFSITDSVKGWGKMKIKDANGNATGSMDVLQVRVDVMVTDSFYIGGMPADPGLLSAFGLTQGQVSETHTMKFYRAGEVTPLLEIQYTDDTYTTPADAYAHVQRLQDPASVGTVNNNTLISVYPNPVTGDAVNIAVKENGNWSYRLTDITGRTIAAGMVSVSGGKAQINVSAANADGIYYLHLNNGETEVVKTLSVIK